MARKAKTVKDMKLKKLISSQARQKTRMLHKKVLSAPLIDSGESTGTNQGFTAVEKMKASFSLQKRKRDESRSRRVTRCRQCSRIHSVYRQFGMCSHCIKIYFDLGWLPGMTKSSW